MNLTEKLANISNMILTQKDLDSKYLTQNISLIADELSNDTIYKLNHNNKELVLISVDNFNKILEEIELLNSIITAHNEYEAGETFSIDDLRSDLKKITSTPKNKQ